MKINVAEKSNLKTHEGAPAARIGNEQQLRRSVMACLLWEDTFYENGESIAKRIADGVKGVSPEVAASIAIEARSKMKLRHVPLHIVREMARLPLHKALVAKTLEQVIQRADELTEFLAIYWKDGRQKVSAQVKKGLAKAFGKFREYDLAKYDQDGKVKLRDVLFLSHAKPKGSTGRWTKAERKAKQPHQLTDGESLFQRVVDRKLATPDTWEVALSGGEDKKQAFERLMSEKKLAALAFIRNLRNMKEAGVAEALVAGYASAVDISRVLPFRFISAARAVPAWEPVIEAMMLRALSSVEKLPGKTAIVVDNSGSMYGAKVSARSEIDRSDAACALAILLREICETCVVIGYGNQAAVIPARRGFALAEAIKKGPGGGTMTDTAIRLANKEGYDRIIVVTDEQSHQAIGGPDGTGYFVNVAVYQNGIGYGKWIHIDGWSESIIEYIRAYEDQKEHGKAR